MIQTKIHSDMLKRLTKSPVLVVHSERILRTSVRSGLQAMGATNVHAMSNYADALQAAQVRTFSYVFFENSKNRNSPPAEFAKAVRKCSPTTFLVAMFEPAYLEDLFRCLQAGVRGFVVIPCTPDALEATLLKATEGLNIPPNLLDGESWDAVFAKFVLKQLDYLCSAVRKSRDNAELVQQIEAQMASFKEAVHMGKAYCAAGNQGFLQEILAQCISSADDKKTRLRKVRERLAKEREKSPDEPAEA